MPNPEDKPIKQNDDGARQTASGLSHELQSFEARLAKLAPRDDRLDRERLVYLAGQASISAANDGRSPPAHDWRRHPAWPAAFAVMTAVAAMLLVLVVSRRESAVPEPFRGGETALRNVPQVRTERDDERTILSTIDTHFGDVEELLARENFLDNSTDTGFAPDWGRGAHLRAGDWHEVLNELEPFEVSPNGASNYLLNRGAAS